MSDFAGVVVVLLDDDEEEEDDDDESELFFDSGSSLRLLMKSEVTYSQSIVPADARSSYRSFRHYAKKYSL